MITAKDYPQILEAISKGVSQGQEAKSNRELAQLQSYLKGQQQQGEQQRNLEMAKSLINDKGMAPGRKLNVKLGDVDLSEAQQMTPVMANLAQQKMQTQQENAYAKGLEKYSDIHGALSDLERITNRDGTGGVLTNPSASLISSGKILSALPDSALGLAELTHMAPEGTSEERKALARVKLSLGHAMTGARMNPTMQKMIQDSLGGISSGDPQLMSKGLRGAAGIVGSQVNTVQSGFAPQVKETVHERLGSDPMDFYKSIVKDAPAGAQPASNSAFNPDSFLKGQ